MGENTKSAVFSHDAPTPTAAPATVAKKPFTLGSKGPSLVKEADPDPVEEEELPEAASTEPYAEDATPPSEEEAAGEQTEEEAPPVSSTKSLFSKAKASA